jgi:hypothetical protein
VGRRIDLRNACGGGDSTADNFTCQLFRLILKADPQRKLQIGLAFPVEVKMVKVWQDGDCPDWLTADPEILGPDDYDDQSLDGPAWISIKKPAWIDANG